MRRIIRGWRGSPAVVFAERDRGDRMRPDSGAVLNTSRQRGPEGPDVAAAGRRGARSGGMMFRAGLYLRLKSSTMITAVVTGWPSLVSWPEPPPLDGGYRLGIQPEYHGRESGGHALSRLCRQYPRPPSTHTAP